MLDQATPATSLAILLLDGVPLIDVRAPIEFAKGAVPTAVNLPILGNDERARVGTCYRQQGREAATALGHQLVSGRRKADRVAAWLEFIERHPNAQLYCARGGQRSAIAVSWLREAGAAIERVAGGFKAIRAFLLGSLDASLDAIALTILSGPTGSGKTRVIDALDGTESLAVDPPGKDRPRLAIDLEGLANHRGSSFGRRLAGQPAPIDFENRLLIALLRAARAQARVVLEDESRMIGRCVLPNALKDRMNTSPIVVIEEDIESRVQVILEDYVCGLRAEHERFAAPDVDAAQAFDGYRIALLDALDRIRKRLGGERHQRIREQMLSAFDTELDDGDVDAHRKWIRALLHDYYDPMYDYQLGQRSDLVRFRGSRVAVLAWLRDRREP